MSEVESIAKNLYRKKTGRYLVYELIDKDCSFTYRGNRMSGHVVNVHRDVFRNTVEISLSDGTACVFREPSYIISKDTGISFCYCPEHEDGEEPPEDVTETVFTVA